MASRNPATLTDKLVTAALLLIVVFSYRTVLVGSQPGGAREAERLQQASNNVLALQIETTAKHSVISE